MRKPTMRATAPLLAILALPLCGLAETLTQADREALLERLDKINESVEKRTEERFGVAVNAYRAAMASDDAALEFYLKCVEKDQFEDKKGQDFREWKRRQEGQLQNAAFKRALRHQLRWLVLTLQYAASKQSPSNLAPEASKIVDDVYNDLGNLAGQRDLLRQPVLGSIFARVYSLSSLKVPDWPQSPIELGAIYGKIILPPLRKAERTDSLRAAWNKRIQQEVLAAEHATHGDKPSRDNSPSPEMEKFMTETYPELLWQEEVDVYRAGDQRNAALRMFQHIDKYLTHPKSQDWTKEFRELLAPKAPATATTPAAPETSAP